MTEDLRRMLFQLLDGMLRKRTSSKVSTSPNPVRQIGGSMSRNVDGARQ